MITAHPANSGAAVDINPASAICANAHYQPESVAVRYAGGDLTYAQLNDRSARLTAALTERGVAAGDRVAYLGLNSPAFSCHDVRRLPVWGDLRAGQLSPCRSGTASRPAGQRRHGDRM